MAQEAKLLPLLPLIQPKTCPFKRQFMISHWRQKLQQALFLKMNQQARLAESRRVSNFMLLIGIKEKDLLAIREDFPEAVAPQKQAIKRQNNFMLCRGYFVQRLVPRAVRAQSLQELASVKSREHQLSSINPRQDTPNFCRWLSKSCAN